MTFASTQEIRMFLETCFKCGVQFGITEYQRNQRLDDGGSFFCPNGHQQAYCKPRVQVLQEALESKEKELRASKCETLNERNARELAERKLSRVDRGVCPKCNRSFCNLASHMKSKHAEKKESK